MFISENLQKNGLLEKIGGGEYLITLMETIPSSLSATKYAEIVRENGLKRLLIAELQKSIDELNQREFNGIDQCLNHLEKLIFSICQNNLSTSPQKTYDVLCEVGELIAKNQFGVNIGIKTGFLDIDNLTGGFKNGSLNIIAGRPSMGKTTFAINIARNIGIAQQSVLIFSLEMSKRQIAVNLLCGDLGISPQKLEGKVSDKDSSQIFAGISKFEEVNVYLDDSAAASFRDM